MSSQSHQPRKRSNNRKHTNSPQINRPQRHPAICADCRDETTVPFRPTEGRPVYCSSCLYLRRNGVASSRSAEGRQSTSLAVSEDASQSDSPAWQTVFSGMVLNRATRTAVARMNISEPTPIQEESIPPLLEGRDLIGQARTGSGKTLAFAVPLVEQCDATARQVQALVLVPTRELAIQVGGVVEDLARPQGLHVTLLYGGRSVGKDHKVLQQGAQIIIGTPGRTLDHVRQGSLKLRSVRFLVLDEADEMPRPGFRPRRRRHIERDPDPAADGPVLGHRARLGGEDRQKAPPRPGHGGG